MPLPEALRRLKSEKPWVPVEALRLAVRAGRIPSVRSSFKNKARYYVRLEDLLASLPTVEPEPTT
jgi:hypothetical protein